MQEQSRVSDVSTESESASETLDWVLQRTAAYMESHSKERRKPYGQFFTSRDAAVFMANLFDIPEGKTELSILDPGAGSGILSAALLERLRHCPGLEKIRLVCYEIHADMAQLLRENLERIRQRYPIRLEYGVIQDNYILSRKTAYSVGVPPQRFDLIIGNPPYRKLPAHAPEALAMADICHGTPNLYFLFASMSLFDLRDGGQMAYLLPRSWTSGAYFQRFRRNFLGQGALEHIHLFESRDRVFERENVLQETLIIKVRKTRSPPPYVTVTSAHDSRDFQNRTVFHAPYHLAVSGENFYVRPIRSQREADALRRVQAFQDTLPSLGLKMKTGLTVDFRCREQLRGQPEARNVPLFYPRHIRNGQVTFPSNEGTEFLSPDRPGLLQPNANYLFVKRFTSKEEPRRLQCAIYLSRRYPAYRQISTQNKLNFISGAEPLSECAVYGLYAIFNSTLYDLYYRVLDGSTQVNASEINSLPVPPLDAIREMGRRLMKTMNLSVENCDRILEDFL